MDVTISFYSLHDGYKFMEDIKNGTYDCVSTFEVDPYVCRASALICFGHSLIDIPDAPPSSSFAVELAEGDRELPVGYASVLEETPFEEHDER